MSIDVMDFSDLGRGIQFKYNGKTYEIPSFSKSEMSALIEISRKLVALSKLMSDEGKKESEQGEVKSEEINAIYSTQQEFVLAGIMVVDESGKRPLAYAEIEGWPWRLINKLIKMINEQMAAVNSGDSGNPT